MKNDPVSAIRNFDRRTALPALLAALVCLLSTGLAAAGGITTLASFQPAIGSAPDSNVSFDASGNLYVTTLNAGTIGGAGTVSMLAAGSHTITAVSTFQAPGPESPYGGVAFDAAGNLYGTTQQGASGSGVVYEIAKGSATVQTLFAFNLSTNAPSGGNPLGGVTFDAAGNLYGTSYSGGAHGDGTIFEIKNGSGTLTTLASFGGTNGANPAAGLTVDAAGNLYGTTYAGGAKGDGTVFEIVKGSGTITSLASFNGTNGANPTAQVTLDAAGNIYGTTYYGGAHGDGTVFEIAKGSGTITSLASFNGTNGQNPRSGVTFDAAGNLYGTTLSGGADAAGAIYELTSSSQYTSLSTLYSFSGGADGNSPYGGLTFDDGNLYGTTSAGGANNGGTIFELSTVPEPASLYLLALGIAALAGRAALGRTIRLVSVRFPERKGH